MSSSYVIFKDFIKDVARTTTVSVRRNVYSHSRTAEFTKHHAARLNNSARYYEYSTLSSSSSSSSQGADSSNGNGNDNDKTNIHTPVVITGTIPVGGQGVALHQTAQTERCFTRKQVQAFGCLVGDKNPLHVHTIDRNEVWKKNHPLLRNNTDLTVVVVHGMLVASLFSSIFGTLIPGAVYLEQSLQFVRPVYVEELVVGKVTIIDIDKNPKRPIAKGIVLTCDTTVLRQNKVCIKGTAKVWLVNGSTQPDAV